MVRQAGTVAGAVAVMAGAGLPWLAHYRTTKSPKPLNISPFHLSVKWLLKGSSGTAAQPVKSIGMLLLLLVGVIVFGLVTAGRGTTILGGAGAILAALAFAFTVMRGPRSLFGTLGLGVYLTTLGGAIAVAGVLLGPNAHHHRH